MTKLIEFFKNDKYGADPVMCRKLQIYPLDGLSIRVMGVESGGRRMTTYYTLESEECLEDHFEMAIEQFLEAAGLEN